jgi:hypothetical protein
VMEDLARLYSYKQANKKLMAFISNSTP